MKQGIHPTYEFTSIRCACGAEYKVRSTKTGQRLEICAACHPFFTGKQKLVDTAGRVEKFKRRYAKMAPKKGEPVAEPVAAEAAAGSGAEPEAPAQS